MNQMNREWKRKGHFFFILTMLSIPSISPANFSLAKRMNFHLEYSHRSTKRMNAMDAIIAKMTSFSSGMVSKMKFFSTLNCSMKAVTTNRKNRNKSTILSATMVPKALSKGMFWYFLMIAARVNSPDLGMVKFRK